MSEGLLGPDDPAPFGLFNAEGASPFLLIGDHAGSMIPEALGDLGLGAADRARHIAIDIGVQGMGMAMASMLDAPFLHQIYSRLVIDCNRDPASDEAIPNLSDGTRIAGNIGISPTERSTRVAAIHASYHAALSRLIDTRRAAGRDTILLSLHSFTPVMDGIARPWEAGVLHWKGRTGFSLALVAALQAEAGLTIGDNEPYRMDDTDYTVPRHAFPNDLPYAEIEVRQDLIGDADGLTRWARRLADAARWASAVSTSPS